MHEMLDETRDHTGDFVPYSFEQAERVCGFFNVPCQPCNLEDVGDRAY